MNPAAEGGGTSHLASSTSLWQAGAASPFVDETVNSCIEMYRDNKNIHCIFTYMCVDVCLCM